MWHQASKRTNNNLTPETRIHSSEVGKKSRIHKREGKKEAPSTSRTEHIVIRCWQRDEMCEGWRQEEETLSPLARQLPTLTGH